MDLSRRGVVSLAGTAALAGLAGSGLAAQEPAGLPVEFGGVRLGTCLYNYRSLPRLENQRAYLATMVEAARQTGVGLVEINALYLEPPTRLPFAGIPRLWDAPLSGRQKEAFEALSPQEVAAERDALREWRLSAPAAYFEAVRDSFRAAGMMPFSYVMTFTPDMTEAEIEAIFGHARALGVNVFSTNQTKVEMAPRLAPFAEGFDMVMGFHNHTAVDNPNEVASVNSLERLFSVSPRMMVNLDTGHFVASGQDVMAFIETHFDRITHFHMKDRQSDHGPNMPFGEGDTPLAAILDAIRAHGSRAPAIVEFEYRGTGTPVEETRRGLQFLKDALGAA